MNEATLISNQYVLANPWQPRENEDPEHIRNLAISIAHDGLMQYAVGRWVDQGGQQVVGVEMADTEDKLATGLRVQLAFGHSRLAAFKFLDDAGNEGFEQFPVVIRDLDDEQMITMAIQENVQRRDLTPMEEARSMLRLRDDFGKTSVEIGMLFGLAESSVRNKIRLLGLPAEIQEAAGKGMISEGAARELLRLYDLPAELQEKAKNYRQDGEWQTKPIVDRALAGVPADQVREMINRVIQQSGNNLHEAQWKWDEAFDLALDKQIRSETCKACECKVVIDNKTYCTAFNCFHAKRDLWIKRRLAMACQACGIRAPEDIHDCGSIKVPVEVRQSGCANLRVIYNSYVRPDEKESLVPGFDDVQIVCGNRNSICTCINGLVARKVAEEKRLQLEDRKQKTGEMIASLKQEPAEPVDKMETPQRGPTADELRQAARDDKQAQRAAVEELNALREEFARRVRDGLLNMNRFVWAAVLEGVYNVRYHKSKIGTVEESAFMAALKLSDENYYQQRIDLDRKRKDLNDILVMMELKPIEAVEDVKEPVYVPIEQTEAPQQGKSLAEVFQEEEDQQFHQALDAVVDGQLLPGQKPGETLMDYFARTEQGALYE